MTEEHRKYIRSLVEAEPYWYHRIELWPGYSTPGWAPIDHSAYGVPDRFDGERVLDVGAWDGYWTFWAGNRGATSVHAIDDFSDQLGLGVERDYWRTFDIARRAFPGMNATRQECSVYDVASKFIVPFDRVFCFGLLYHLKHPVLALERLRSVMNDGATIHIESAILDDLKSPYTGKKHLEDGCYAEFYPGKEYGNNPTNWWVPTLRCLEGWLVAAGFDSIETWKLTENPKSLSECRGFARAVACGKQ